MAIWNWTAEDLKRRFPIIEAARHYSVSKLRCDLVAGLTVAVVAVPQSMAYALIADVDPVYGLYTAIVQGLLAAIFTSSSHLSTGPINTLSLLVASAVARTIPDPALRVQYVIAMTFLVGLIQLGAAAARMAGLVQYVSHSVIVGFTAGAGILIAAQQVPSFLGVGMDTERRLPGLLGIIERMAPHLSEINLAALAIGVGALAVVIICRIISRFAPGPLLAAALAGLVVWIMQWDQGQIRIVGALPTSLPAPQWPMISWADAEKLIGGAFALALVGMLEAFSIAKSIAAKTGQNIRPNQEFLAQGVSNFVSSFFQCIPGSGSFSRSALNHQAGAATSFAGVYTSLFVAVIFLLFAPLAGYIPLASLAAILFVIAYGLIDWRYMLQVTRSSRPDAIVCYVTLAATLLVPLEFAILFGVFLNIGLYLRTASRLHMAQMVQAGAGRFLETPIHDRLGQRKVIFLQMEGDLFFAVADELKDRLSYVAKSGVRVVIFRLKRTHSVDATVLRVMEDFIKEVRSRGGHVILCGVKQELMDTMRKYGLVEFLGRQNVFATGYGVFASARMAMQRARELLGSSIDTEGFDFDDEEKERDPGYQI